MNGMCVYTHIEIEMANGSLSHTRLFACLQHVVKLEIDNLSSCVFFLFLFFIFRILRSCEQFNLHFHGG